ncbi:MAG: HAMP domain-containing protein [Myxococcaceae bacterium]|nr:HAMP domain-containing protein [Myxococcaceae bacterium]
MRLRTTLVLAFWVLALLQVAAVTPIALANVSALLVSQQHARIEQVMGSVDTTLKKLEQDTLRAMDELATSRALEDVVRETTQLPAQPAVATAAGALMVPRGLEVLSLFDVEGETLSCGHLPAKLGEKDEALFAVIQQPASDVVPVAVELRSGGELKTAPAWVTARAVDYGDHRVWAVGGVLLNETRAQDLAKLTGAQVTLLMNDVQVAEAGSAEPPLISRTIAFGKVARARFAFSQADLIATQAQLLRAFVLLAALGVAVALVIGPWVSRRVTRPVEALTEAAARIAQGELDVQVPLSGSGEVRALIDTFNRMTHDLKATTEQLVASERIAAWQEVARRLAHEIKNPLTPIQMSLETMLALREKDSTKFNQLFKESAGAVLEEVARLKRIVDEFSRFARLPKPQLETLNLTELCGQVMGLYSSNGGRVRYVAEMAPGITVRGDRDQLTQVIINLVKNAEEAMGEKGGQVTLRLTQEAGHAHIDVEDQGPGIAESDRERIFEPYFTTKSGGTGLGLAIASRIVTEHGGSLTAGGELGRGAVFTLTLPHS